MESSDVSIRIARVEDIAALVEFNRAMARETEDKELSRAVLTSGIETLMNRPEYGFYIVAEDSTAGARDVIGSLMITYEWTDWRNGVFWWIQSVYVKPDFRRRGIYRKLYEYIKRLAADDTLVRGFRLYVEKENSVAQSVYENLGMTPTSYRMFEELLNRES